MDEDQSKKPEKDAKSLRAEAYKALEKEIVPVYCVVTNIGRKEPRNPSEVELSEIWYKGKEVPVESGLSDLDFRAHVNLLLRPFTERNLVWNVKVDSEEEGCLTFEVDARFLRQVRNRMPRDRVMFACDSDPADAKKIVANAKDFLVKIRDNEIRHVPRPYLDA